MQVGNWERLKNYLDWQRGSVAKEKSDVWMSFKFYCLLLVFQINIKSYKMCAKPSDIKTGLKWWKKIF